MALAGPAPAISRVTPFLTGVIARHVVPAGATPSHAVLLKTHKQLYHSGTHDAAI